jgi:hypothetical protein
MSDRGRHLRRKILACVAALIGGCGGSPSRGVASPARPAPAVTPSSKSRVDERPRPVAPRRAEDELVVSHRFGNEHVWAPSWYPWYYLWSTAPDDGLLGTNRASAVDVYAVACATVPLAAHGVTPFASDVLGYDEVNDGAIVHFALAAGPPEALLAHLRCHRAWLVAAQSPAPSESALALHGLDVTVHASPDTIEVLISARDPVVVTVLKERLRRTKTARPRRL